MRAIVKAVMHKALREMSELFWNDDKPNRKGPLWARAVWKCRVIFPESWYT